MEKAPTIQREKQNRVSHRVQLMGMALGVNLHQLVRNDELPSDLRESMTVRCMGCLHSEKCDEWLARNAVGADATPRYCRNAEILHDIASEAGADGAVPLKVQQPVKANVSAIDDVALQAMIRECCFATE